MPSIMGHYDATKEHWEYSTQVEKLHKIPRQKSHSWTCAFTSRSNSSKTLRSSSNWLKNCNNNLLDGSSTWTVNRTSAKIYDRYAINIIIAISRSVECLHIVKNDRKLSQKITSRKRAAKYLRFQTRQKCHRRCTYANGNRFCYKRKHPI